MIIIIMLFCDGECLKLCHFSSGLLKMFYLQTVQTVLYVCFHEKTYLRESLNLTCFRDLLLESCKYDKTKVRFIVINYHLPYGNGTSDQLQGFKLDIKWKHLESKNANFQYNFRVISNVFDFMNLRNEFHKMFCKDNN